MRETGVSCTCADCGQHMDLDKSIADSVVAEHGVYICNWCYEVRAEKKRDEELTLLRAVVEAAGDYYDARQNHVTPATTAQEREGRIHEREDAWNRFEDALAAYREWQRKQEVEK